jgi:hypothetical protein
LKRGEAAIGVNDFGNNRGILEISSEPVTPGIDLAVAIM